MHVPAKSARNENADIPIKGQTDSAIAVGDGASGFTVTINNNADATLMGGGTAFAAVRTGADNDTINNAGIINGATGLDAIFRLDGTYTDVSAVPLPESYGMLISGLGLLGVLGYRRRRNAPRPLVAPAHQVVTCAF